MVIFENPSDEVEEIFSTPIIVANSASIGEVKNASTASGDTPAHEIETVNRGYST
jgi:hypothetical protein